MYRPDQTVFRAEVDHPATGQTPDGGERKVGADAETEHQAQMLAVLGDETEALAHGGAGPIDLDALAVEQDLAAVGRRGAEHAQRHLRAAGADKSGQAHDLAAPQVERHVPVLGFAGQLADGEDDRLAFGARRHALDIREIAGRP